MEKKDGNGLGTWADEFSGIKGELALQVAYAGSSDFSDLIYHLFERPPFMLDRDVAAVYKVPTKHLMQQVKRHKERFTENLIFQLTEKEVNALIAQNVLATRFRNGVRSRSQKMTGFDNQFLPWGFTRTGANHIAHYLRSEVAKDRSFGINRTGYRRIGARDRASHPVRQGDRVRHDAGQQPAP